MKKDIILVVGASGTIGSELVRILRAQGHQVRTTTSRSATEKHSIQVDLGTGKGIHQAFEGVDRAFLMSPPGYADQHSILSPLIQEAKRRGLKKVVLMTAMGANAVETAPFRRAEIELENSGLSYNIVRPNWFMQNFNTFWVGGIQQRDTIQLPAGGAKTSFIHAWDVSEVAAVLLTSDRFNNQDFDLTGPVALSHSEVAASISQAIDRPVTYQDIEPEVLKNGLVQAGLPIDYVDFLILIFGFLKAGYSERTTDHVKKILGRAPRRFETYAQENKNAWAR